MSVELSHEKLEELRKIVKEDLEKVPEGMHKPIDPDVMDKLIFKPLPRFDGKVIKNNNGLSDKLLLADINEKLSHAKVPIWTGEFLSKVDMSGVSFEGAILDFFEIGEFFRQFEENANVNFSSSDVKKYIDKIASYYHQLPSRYKLEHDFDGTIRVGKFMIDETGNSYNDSKVIVDFSNTNISFNPSELFVAKREANYWGDDSDDDFDKLPDINWDTGLVKDNNDYPHIANCSFANADLGCKDWGHVYLENCDLSNTGAVIKIDTRKSEVVNGARSCELVGCVVNGKPVERKKITPDKKEAILAELGDLQAQYMAAINVEAVPKSPRR